jgi:4-hydroxyphenylpyruvate dioxygenase
MASQGENGTSHTRKLVGHAAFKRHNPLSDKFASQKFEHVEFYCGDATTTSRRFGYGLGMTLVAKSDQGTRNHTFASYVMRSGDITFTFTAPYSITSAASHAAANGISSPPPPIPWYDQEHAYQFLKRHGLAVRSLAIRVSDAEEAFHTSVKNGALGVQPPTIITDEVSGTSSTVSEVVLYGDVVLRYVSGDYKGPYLPGYVPVDDAPVVDYGLRRLDHAVGNVPKLIPAVEYICNFSGFHEFAEFVSEDVGTVDSGLNSMVLANNTEMILLPINEPTFGTYRKSQIQTYLEQNEGAGLQHLALKTDDIVKTLREMRSRSDFGGFDFMPNLGPAYYKELPGRIGDALPAEKYTECEELGILVDIDDQGVLLQIFTKPLGDRPTVFIEIIERLCKAEENQSIENNGAEESVIEEIGGCGGFGKGNFGALFKSIEVYETDLGINKQS